MPHNDPITPLLRALVQWLPPEQAVHIGATIPAIYQVLKDAPLLVFDADATTKDQTQRQLPQIDLTFAPQVIAECTGIAVWHQASNPAESGLVPPEQLRPYWQNLKTLTTQNLSASSLDEALTAHQVQPGWLWIDCFPALALLRGAPTALAHANVVLARTIIDPVNAPEDTDLPALQTYMQQRGFVLAAVQHERHPAIGTALFFRDFAKIAIALQAALDTANKAREKQANELLGLASQAQAAAAKIVAIEAEKAQFIAAHGAEAKSKSEAIAARDAHAKLVSECQAALDAASKAQEKQAKELLALASQVPESTAKIAAGEAERAKLVAAHAVEVKAKQEAIAARDAQAKLVNERQAALDAASKAQEQQAKEFLALSSQAQATTEKIAAAEAEKAKLVAALAAEAKAKQEAIATRDAQTKLASERQAALDAASKAQEKQAKELLVLASQAQEATVKVAAAEAERAKLVAAHAVELKGKQEAIAARDAQAKLATERQTALDTASKDHEEKLQRSEIDIQFKKQSDGLITLQKFLDGLIKREVTNATKQIEAFIGVQDYLASGNLPTLSTEKHSWPISPDFALYLIELLETSDYDLVIEFGSGVSTVLIAQTLAKINLRRQGKPETVQVAFEHLDAYYRQTLAALKQARLDGHVSLALTPLQPYTAPNGNTYPYYGCDTVLARLAVQYPPANLHVLVLVDGPPSATGKHARYPAAPAVLAHFKGAHIDLLLDDYIRDDEKEIAQLWQAEFTAAGIVFTATQRSLEKDACLIALGAPVN